MSVSVPTSLSSSPIVLLCFFLDFLPVRAVVRHCAYMSVCLPTCLTCSLSVSYLFIYILSYLSLWYSPCCLEARLPSRTVKCLADWKGHFSNGAMLPLIFCLSLGVRLIYHASSPADIQIHFDWRLQRMTPTTNITAALTQRHRVKCDSAFSTRYAVGMNMPVSPTQTHSHF